MQESFYGWIHITANCFYFDLNVLNFELQYKWTPLQIYFRGYRVLKLLCHNVDGAHDIKFSQKYLELKFCEFHRLGSNFTRGSNWRCSIKKLFLKIYNIHRKTPVTASLFKLQLYSKRDSGTGFFLRFLEDF